MKKDLLQKRPILAHHRYRIPESKRSMGSIQGKYPVIFNDGKTIIYISDKDKEAETRLKYELIAKGELLFNNTDRMI